MFTRNCSNCDKLLTYTLKSNRDRAQKLDGWCVTCRKKEEANRPEVRKRRSEAGKKRVGKKNSFFGKRHSETTKNEMSVSRKETYKKFSDDKKLKIKNHLMKYQVDMTGRSLYSVWVEKYGIEEADKRKENLRIKQSINSSGKNNPMYGKPSPTGSGNGWSGWYKNWYFRSLLELSYMINHIEKNNLDWVCGESKKFRVKYIDYKGSSRNYYPDFIIGDKIMVECKPKRLWESDNVKRKTEAAKKFCELNEMEYLLIDPEKLNDFEILELVRSGNLKFLERYEKKLKERYGVEI